MRRIVQLDILLFAFGFVIGTALASPALWCAVVGALASVLHRIWFHRTWSTPALGLCAATLVVALHEPRPGPLQQALARGPSDFLIVGELTDGPRTLPSAASFELRVLEFDGRATSENVRLFAHDMGDAVAGDPIETFARCALFAPAEFPGDRGAAARWAARGVVARCSTREPIRRVDAPRSIAGTIRAQLANRRLRIERDLQHVLGGRAGVPIAMITGTRGLVTHSERRAHQRAGTAHLLAISGVHFGALAAIVWGCAGFMLRRVRRVTRTIGARRASAGVVLATMLAYLLFVGAPVSAVRASVAMAAIVVALMLGRRASGIAAVCAAAIGLLLSSPQLVWDLGFQLSFAATFAIVLFWLRMPTPLQDDRYLFEARSRARALGLAFARFVLMSWAATAATTPILLGTLGELSWAAFVTNVFAVPLVSLAIFPALLAGTALLSAWPPVGQTVVWWATEAMLRLTLLVEELAALPGAVVTPGVAPGWWTAVAVAAVFGAIADRLRPRAVVAAVAVIASASAIAYAPGDARWTLHFIPVGQGDATLIESPDGHRVLIDAGGAAFGGDPGRAIVVPYLRRAGVTRLDALVITHADTDHAGGVPAVLEEVAVDRLVTEPVDLGLAELSLTRWIDTGSRNERSIVATLTVGGAVVVLPGDVEREAERAWTRDAPHRALVLKAAHHGSRTSTTTELLDAMAPKIAIISAGRHNRFGHPHRSVLERLGDHAVRTYTTAADGLVVVEVFTDGVVRVRVRRPSR